MLFRSMSRKRQFFAIVATVLVLSSALSHLLVRVLAIGTDAIDRGKIDNSPGEPVLMIGSSLTFFGVSFRQIAKVMERPLVTCGVGGCSPCELETFAREVPEATRLISGVSLFDLIENNFSDSRVGHAAASTIWSPRRLAKQSLASQPSHWMVPRKITGTMFSRHFATRLVAQWKITSPRGTPHVQSRPG